MRPFSGLVILEEKRYNRPIHKKERTLISLFYQEERVVYKNHQLIEVVCQLRFPAILAISQKPPVEFQEAIRKTFPQYIVRHDPLPPKMVQNPGEAPRLEHQKPMVNHQFITADGCYRVNLTQHFISLACNKYCCWEDFAAMMDKALASFIKIYEPAYFERVGLRYLNGFSKKALELDTTPWREMLQPGFLGLLAEEDIQESAFARCSQNVECALRGGCHLKMQVGPGMVKIRKGSEVQEEPRLMLDLDVFMPGNVPVNLAAASMETAHAQAGSIFRAAITDTLHDAMEPDV